VAEVVGDGADRARAVEVGHMLRDRALDLSLRQDARAGSLMADTAGDPLVGEANLLTLYRPGLARALRGQARSLAFRV
jgi:hypothetical protein